MYVIGTDGVSFALRAPFTHFRGTEPDHLLHNSIQMVSASLEAAGVSHFIQGQHLVGNVQRYKPATVVYQDLLQSLGKTEEPQNVWLVSG